MDNRKNWLFAGSDEGGERAASIYLRYVLGGIADHPINRIEELLPWNVVLPAPAATSLAA